MGRPKVNNPMFHGSGGWGAVQLVGKYDVLDMSDTGNELPSNQGTSTTEFRGRLRNVTAISWGSYTQSRRRH